MSRQSSDEMKNGLVFNGFDYDLQVWVIKGIIPDCGHPPAMSRHDVCCNAKRYAGLALHDVLAERGMLKTQGM